MDYITKQTPRGGSVNRAGDMERPSDKPLQVELDGPEVLMEPLREQDAIKRRQAIADAMKDTQVQYAESTAADMKK